MVWGVIAYNTRPLLVLIRGTMTAQQYVHDFMQLYVLPLLQRLSGANFQQDNARSHTARMSQNCRLIDTTLLWPALSPDLSPIDHIWYHLGRRVWHFTSLNELEARLQQIWKEMSEDLIQNLDASMPDRIASCIRTTGAQQFKITRQAGNPIFAIIVRAELVILCFISYNVNNVVAMHNFYVRRKKKKRKLNDNKVDRENREGLLGYPRDVTPMVTDSKPLRNRKKTLKDTSGL
ncbi:transposable element Tcb1 transposase [Trichonephila clavipes]|nr:transposable element Tcb1 transposase [Trichonephila clavipes]